MPDREKVIKGLECCIWKEQQGKCEECPYYLTLCIKKDAYQLKEDALALLKVQEPRVMTLVEAQGADYCWYESRTANICILSDATMYYNYNGKPKTELQAMGTSLRGWQYDDSYGKDWRCWTSRPTDEQREATPWQTPSINASALNG